MIVWPFVLGGGAAAAAAAAYVLTRKKEGPPVLPPYVGPAAPPVIPVTPVYRPPAYMPPIPPPAPSEVKPQYLPLPVRPEVPGTPVPPPPPPPYVPPTIPQIFPSWSQVVTDPFLSPGTLQTTPTTYQATQGQPGPGGVPFSFSRQQVTGSGVNLRQAPNGTVLGQMPKGSAFLVNKIEGGWAYGKSEALGKIGWASAQYIGGAGAMTETFSSQPYGQATESFSAGVSGAAKGSVYVEGFRTLIRQTMPKKAAR